MISPPSFVAERIASIGTKYRTLTGEKKFTQDAGGRQIFWNLDCLRDSSLATEPLIITEGELDAMAALQAGFPRRCDVCWRCARLYLAEIRDTDYRTKAFSCCRCGTGGALAITEPNKETGMTDYQLDQVEGPQHHPGALARLTGPLKPAHRLSAKHYGVKAPTR